MKFPKTIRHTSDYLTICKVVNRCHTMNGQKKAESVVRETPIQNTLFSDLYIKPSMNIEQLIFIDDHMNRQMKQTS